MTSLPGSSTRIKTSPYAEQLTKALGQREVVLNTADGFIEEFVHPGMKAIPDLAIVLTNLRLIGIRPKGMLGQKKPFVVDLAEVTEVGETREHNVSVQSETSWGQPNLCKLHLGGDPGVADQWMHMIHDASTALA